ncbi:Uncharacterised protein [Bordetella pertussis]|nr:Uncharacterised protein [Bordetella pertussis]
MAFRSQNASSSAPTAAARSPCPPGFSLRSMMALARAGSNACPPSSSSSCGAACSRRGMKRSRISPGWA